MYFRKAAESDLEVKTITSDVSLTAKSFFENNYFEVVQEQSNERNGVILVNFKMKKEL